MNIKVDLGLAGKVEVEDVDFLDVLRVDTDDVSRLFYSLDEANRRVVAVDYLQRLDDNEFKEIMAKFLKEK